MAEGGINIDAMAFRGHCRDKWAGGSRMQGWSWEAPWWRMRTGIPASARRMDRMGGMGRAGSEYICRERRRVDARNKKGPRCRHRDPGKCLVGMSGFEPPASASRTQRSSQTEPHPDDWKTALLHNRPWLGKKFRCGCLSGPSPVKLYNSAMQRPFGAFLPQGPIRLSGAEGSSGPVRTRTRLRGARFFPRYPFVSAAPCIQTREGDFGDTRCRGR